MSSVALASPPSVVQAGWPRALPWDARREAAISCQMRTKTHMAPVTAGSHLTGNQNSLKTFEV